MVQHARLAFAFALVSAVAAVSAVAQEPAPKPAEPVAQEPPAQESVAQEPEAAAGGAVEGEKAEPEWTFGLSVYTYVVPDEGDYLQPTLTADRGMLHLEARLNYEDRDTASLWAGANFSFGEELVWDVTPMLGVVFGETDGIAPGYRTSLSWRAFEVYSEGEYVLDSHDSSDDYFYTWSEWTVAPVEWLRVGAVIQRTRTYDAERDVQRGLLLGISHENFSFTATVFNPDESEPILVFSLGADF